MAAAGDPKPPANGPHPDSRGGPKGEAAKASETPRRASDDSKSTVSTAAPVAASSLEAGDRAARQNIPSTQSSVTSPPPERPAANLSDPPPYALVGQREVFIAVMGQTGTGKSSFINLVTGHDLEVGEDLSSCKPTLDLCYSS
jgi:hypothetical protein